jgi:hypothetical protein
LQRRCVISGTQFGDRQPSQSKFIQDGNTPFCAQINLGLYNLLILVGIAGFEPVAFCTPYNAPKSYFVLLFNNLQLYPD